MNAMEGGGRPPEDDADPSIEIEVEPEAVRDIVVRDRAPA